MFFFTFNSDDMLDKKTAPLLLDFLVFIRAVVVISSDFDYA